MARDKTSGERPPNPRVKRRNPKSAAKADSTARGTEAGTVLPRKLLSCLKGEEFLFNDAVRLIDTDRNIAEIKNATGLTPDSDWTIFDRDYPHIGNVEETKRYKLIHSFLVRYLKDGVLKSFGYENGRYPRVDIAPAEWANGLSLSYFNTATRYSDSDGLDNVELLNIHVTYENSDKGEGGAPETYDWELLLQELFMELMDEPKKILRNGKNEWSTSEAHEKLRKIYQREYPYRRNRKTGKDATAGPSRERFSQKMRELYPRIWTSWREGK